MIKNRDEIRRKKIRKRKLIRIAIITGSLILLLALSAAATFAVLSLVHRGGNGESGESPTEQSSSVTTTDAADATTTTVSTTTVPTTTASVSGSGGQSIDDAYFRDALFIGDSRTEGLQLYNVIPSATFYTAKGLNVNSVYTTKAVKINGDRIPIMEAVKQKSFGKVYVMLGLNELGWVYDSVFVEKYGKMIDEIKKAQPNAEIYVQTILPVTAKKSESDKIFNNENIRKYNLLIKKLAEDKKVGCLDTFVSVADSSGSLPADAATDGIHLTKKYCIKWAEFLSRT